MQNVKKNTKSIDDFFFVVCIIIKLKINYR